MKNLFQYCSLAFQHWAAHWKESTLIVLLSIIIVCLLMGLVVPCVLLAKAAPVVGGIALVVVGLLVMAAGLLLYYYLPVCFLTLNRNEPISRERLKINRWRAMGVAVMTLLPSIVSQILQACQGDELSTGIKLAIGLISLGVSIFALIWAYAVAAPLPLLAHDNREESVGQLVRYSWDIMNGYKWKLFCIDFMLVFLPLIVMCTVMVGMLIPVVMAGGASAVSDPDIWKMYAEAFSAHKGGAIFVGVIMLIEWFVLIPVGGFARAEFYDDLIAEQAKATDATGQAEVVEAVVTEEVKEN